VFEKKINRGQEENTVKVTKLCTLTYRVASTIFEIGGGAPERRELHLKNSKLFRYFGSEILNFTNIR
jgi:hypothetical protein